MSNSPEKNFLLKNWEDFGLLDRFSSVGPINGPFVLLEVAAVDSQRPNLMGNLTGTVLLGRVDRAKSLPEPVKTLTNKLGIKLVRIEADEFMMGIEDFVDELAKAFPNDSKDWFEYASAPQRVKITRPFYLGAHEVTVGQFRSFIEATGYKSEGESWGGGVGIQSDGTRKFDPTSGVRGKWM